MKKKIIILSFFLILLITIIFSLKLWFNMDFINISTNGIVAISICIIVSLLLGFGLMGLAFFSSRFGFDEQVNHDLDSLLEKHKKL
jgi:membrane glycosyltransferase